MNITNNRTARFSALPWTPLADNEQVIIGGAGGIGSWLAVMLGRLQCNIVIYDSDDINEVNLGGQLFRASDIGQGKSYIVARTVQEFTGKIPTNRDFYDAGSAKTPYMFSAFDNMAARKTMFARWKEMAGRELFVDGRMLAENMQVFAVTRENEHIYEAVHLFDDSEVDDAACTSKATSHCGSMIASLMTSVYTNYLANIRYESDIREVPFEIKFDIETMTFRTYDITDYPLSSSIPQGESEVHSNVEHIQAEGLAV